jgi:uncharacterized protein YrrD
MDITIGVPVRAEDGAAGRVERIILHPDTQQFEGIVAVRDGLLHSDVVIPADWVLGEGNDGLLVRGTLDEISSLPSFTHSQYTEPPENWIPPGDAPAGAYLFPASPYAVGAFTPPATQPAPPAHELEELAPNDVDLTADTTVYCNDGAAGKVHRVLTAGDTDRVSHLVVHRTGVGGRDIAVPLDQVEGMDEEGVRLAVSREALDRMPTFDD